MLVLDSSKQGIRLSDDFESTAKEAWFQVIPYQTVHKDGRTIEFDRAKCAGIKALFDSYDTPLPIDFNHQLVSASQKTEPVATGGYIVALDVREDGLWALGKFNERAIAQVREGNAFCSPVILTDTVDRKSGKQVPYELWNVSIVPNPSLDGQVPIRLSTEMSSANIVTMKAKETKMDTSQPIVAADAPQPGDTPSPEDNAPAPATAEEAVIAKLMEATGAGSIGDLASMIEAKLDDVVKVLKGSNTSVMCSTPKKKPMSSETEVLSRQLELLNTEVSALRAEKAAAEKIKETERLDRIVKDLYERGCLVKELEPLARQEFANDATKAAQLFSRQIVPLGTQAGPDPRKSVGFDSLTEAQKVNFHALKQSVAYRFASDDEVIADVLKM